MTSRRRLPAALALVVALALPACATPGPGDQELRGPEGSLDVDNPAPNPGQKPPGESFEEVPGNKGT